LTRAIIAGSIAVLFPTFAWAQTGYGPRLCNEHIAAIVDCSCADPRFEHEFTETRLASLLQLRAAEVRHGAESMHVWLQRMNALNLERSLRRLDVLAVDACAMGR
jgi:hypothetical protein